MPTVSLRIGHVTFPAQLDTGFGDSVHSHSININRPLLEALSGDRVPMSEVVLDPASARLASCDGSYDEVREFLLSPPGSLEFLDSGGGIARRYTDATFFLKSPTTQSEHCAGIATWDIPAAQTGASFVEGFGVMIADPFASLVWIPAPHF